MSCSSCKTKNNNPKGCKNNGVCGTDGCNKLNVFNWLSNLNPISNETSNYYEVRFKNGRKIFTITMMITSISILEMQL